MMHSTTNHVSNFSSPSHCIHCPEMLVQVVCMGYCVLLWVAGGELKAVVLEEGNACGCGVWGVGGRCSYVK